MCQLRPWREGGGDEHAQPTVPPLQPVFLHRALPWLHSDIQPFRIFFPAQKVAGYRGWRGEQRRYKARWEEERDPEGWQIRVGEWGV